MSESVQEVYRQHRTTQDQYTYFLLAAAGAAIALAVQQTMDRSLSLSLLPLGAAVLSWGASFYCGCLQLQYLSAILYANMDLLIIEQGRHPKVGNHPDYIEAASSGVKKAIDGNSNRVQRYARWQFRLLVLGAILFVGWHVIEMALRTKWAASARQPAAEQRESGKLSTPKPAKSKSK
jgi:uncharacterized membrane protein YgdD (TMEM256/DUF423 family)